MSPEEKDAIKSLVKNAKHFTLGELLLTLRKVMGYSRSHVARSIGRTQQNMIAIEGDAHVARNDALIALAKFYHVPLSLLMMKAIELYKQKRKPRPVRCSLDALDKIGEALDRKDVIQLQIENKGHYEPNFGELLESLKQTCPMDVMPENWGKVCDERT